MALKLRLHYDYDSWTLYVYHDDGDVLQHELDERYMSGHNKAIREAQGWLRSRHGIEADAECFEITGVPDGWRERMYARKAREAILKKRPPPRTMRDVEASRKKKAAQAATSEGMD